MCVLYTSAPPRENGKGANRSAYVSTFGEDPCAVFGRCRPLYTLTQNIQPLHGAGACSTGDAENRTKESTEPTRLAGDTKIPACTVPVCLGMSVSMLQYVCVYLSSRHKLSLRSRHERKEERTPGVQ